MAVLSALERARAVAGFMRDDQGVCAYLKPDLAAALAAADDWVEANQAAYNAALPQPFRGAATAAQKVALLAYVLWRRIGRLRVAEDN